MQDRPNLAVGACVEEALNTCLTILIVWPECQGFAIVNQLAPAWPCDPILFFPTFSQLI